MTANQEDDDDDDDENVREAVILAWTAVQGPTLKSWADGTQLKCYHSTKPLQASNFFVVFNVFKDAFLVT
jgi:hypothetical protein